MESLIVYDVAGEILNIKSGTTKPKEPAGVPFLWVEIPSGKQLKITDGIGVDTSVTPHQAILEDIPLTEMDILKDKLQATQDAVDFLIMNGGL